MKGFLPLTALLLPLVAHAQHKFSIGPKVGYTFSSLNFRVADYPDHLTTPGLFDSGFEAGVLAQLQLGSHLHLQPAVLYTRRAPGASIESDYKPNNYRYSQPYRFQFNYLTVPVNLLYSWQPEGRGGHMFAGPYLGWLLGGKYTSSVSAGYGGQLSSGPSFSGRVEAGDTYATTYGDTNYYSRQVDFGLQAGGGYAWRSLQLQGSFSYGLRNIGAAYAPSVKNNYAAPTIHNYGFLLSAAYLFQFN